jgi:hypothetical protein
MDGTRFEDIARSLIANRTGGRAAGRLLTGLSPGRPLAARPGAGSGRIAIRNSRHEGPPSGERSPLS